jgi:hypothetical protein
MTMHQDKERLVAFSGPFSWINQPQIPSLWEAPELSKPGIYIWTVELPEGHLIFYVGETGTSLRQRLGEHYKKLTTAQYHVYDPAQFARGKRVSLWPGTFRNVKSVAECDAALPMLRKPITEIVRMLRLFIAPLDCDLRTRRRIEAAIAQPLYSISGMIREFQDPTIRYHAREAGEASIACRLTSSTRMLGVQERFLA